MTFRIATRGSALALWQANHVADRLREKHPGLETELVVYKTMGDHILDKPLAEIGGKGLFTKELEDGLYAKAVHCAVHSLKDMPTQLPTGLILGAIPTRADVRDCIVRRAGDLSDPGLVGTASLRRMALAQDRWPTAQIEPIRGNVQTRMGRVHESGKRRVDAVILAMAGLLRLQLPQTEEQYDFSPLNPEKWIPAVGQGALAIECREDDTETLDLLSALHDHQTAQCVTAERAFMRAVEGDCRVPVGGYATADGPSLRLRAFIATTDGKTRLVETRFGRDADQLGQDVAQHLLDSGGREILANLRGRS
ncbi:MAG: hydroxymethylbilane synthase [Myxococcota bacterium]|nr:hydroxymethylbilane synthase [Myxococcota bacterium]